MARNIHYLVGREHLALGNLVIQLEHSLIRE